MCAAVSSLVPLPGGKPPSLLAGLPHFSSGSVPPLAPLVGGCTQPALAPLPAIKAPSAHATWRGGTGSALPLAVSEDTLGDNDDEMALPGAVMEGAVSGAGAAPHRSALLKSAPIPTQMAPQTLPVPPYGYLRLTVQNFDLPGALAGLRGLRVRATLGVAQAEAPVVAIGALSADGPALLSLDVREERCLRLELLLPAPGDERGGSVTAASAEMSILPWVARGSWAGTIGLVDGLRQPCGSLALAAAYAISSEAAVALAEIGGAANATRALPAVVSAGAAETKVCEATEAAAAVATAGFAPMSAFTAPEIAAAFLAFDLDGNGYVGAAELRQIFAGLGEPATDEELDGMLALADPDGSAGQISFAQFQAMVLGEGSTTSSGLAKAPPVQPSMPPPPPPMHLEDPPLRALRREAVPSAAAAAVAAAAASATKEAEEAEAADAAAAGRSAENAPIFLRSESRRASVSSMAPLLASGASVSAGNAPLVLDHVDADGDAEDAFVDAKTAAAARDSKRRAAEVLAVQLKLTLAKVGAIWRSYTTTEGARAAAAAGDAGVTSDVDGIDDSDDESGRVSYATFCELLDVDACVAAETVFKQHSAGGAHGKVLLSEVLIGLSSFAPGAAATAREGRLQERLRLCFAMVGAPVVGGGDGGCGCGLNRARLTRLLRGTLFASSSREVARKVQAVLDMGDTDSDGVLSLVDVARVLSRLPRIVFPYGAAAVAAGAS